MKLALVYNPKLAPKRLNRVNKLAAVLESRGHLVSHYNGIEFDAARDAGDADCVIMAGGDGTARLVIQKQSDPGALPDLAIYPTGTINLLARELDYPRNPHKFAARLESGSQQLTTRLATIDGAPFLACASIGFDAHAVASVSEALKLRIGRFAYVAALLSLAKNWPRHPVTIDTGEERIEAETLFILRGKFYAGPWTLDRGANLKTEKLRILALPHARRRDMLLLALYAMLGSRRPHGHWRFLEADRVTLSGGEGIPVQADGDIVASAPVTFELTPTKVTFL
ncbi:diacylglycerol/lipid kinase family protein [Altererythrobacter sp. MF3-039]|uniref:diacylglycerol/lipid kinase family protein n=1 Tax=Altererythrobacter sp. MF3-039 TaxID=3252901 RepID=UPI00390C4BE8